MITILHLSAHSFTVTHFIAKSFVHSIGEGGSLWSRSMSDVRTVQHHEKESNGGRSRVVHDGERQRQTERGWEISAGYIILSCRLGTKL